MTEQDLFQLCLMVAWQPIKAAVKRPLVECTTAPAGVAPADYQKHLGCVCHIQPRMSAAEHAFDRICRVTTLMNRLQRRCCFGVLWLLGTPARCGGEKFRFVGVALSVIGNWYSGSTQGWYWYSDAVIENLSCGDTMGSYGCLSMACASVTDVCVRSSSSFVVDCQTGHICAS